MIQLLQSYIQLILSFEKTDSFDTTTIEGNPTRNPQENMDSRIFHNQNRVFFDWKKKDNSTICQILHVAILGLGLVCQVFTRFYELFIHSLNHSLIHSVNHSFTHSLFKTHLFIHSFIETHSLKLTHSLFKTHSLSLIIDRIT